MEMLVVTIASLLAGFIDAIVGGGGLILLPALFAVFVSSNAVLLIGTSKGAAVFGTAISAYKYSFKIKLLAAVLIPTTICAAVGSLFGAYLVTIISPDLLRKILPLILLMILLYTLFNKRMGNIHNPRITTNTLIITTIFALLIGIYDGFFGPGTGSFFIFLLVRVVGYDFLHASAYAKILNLATNISALTLMSFKGFIWWQLAIPLAAANVIGAILGVYFAIRFGTGFVRWIFIIMVSTLILKVGFDAYF